MENLRTLERIQKAAKEYDEWPDSFKEAFRLSTIVDRVPPTHYPSRQRRSEMNTVEKLRSWRLANCGNGINGEFFGQVADEIEALQLAAADAKNAGLREAAEVARGYCIDNCKSHHDDAVDTTAHNITEDILARIPAGGECASTVGKRCRTVTGGR